MTAPPPSDENPRSSSQSRPDDREAASPVRPSAPLADWWERLVARVIDGMIAGVLYYILFNLFMSAFGPEVSVANMTVDTDDNPVLPGLLAWLITGAAYVAYDYLLHSRDGQTVGKKVMKIRLVAVSGVSPDDTVLWKRSVIFPGPQLLFGIPVVNGLAAVFMFVVGLFVLLDKPLQQGLHDRLAGTVVVKVAR